MTGWFGIAKRFRDKRTEARVQSLDFESIARRSPDLKDAGAADPFPSSDLLRLEKSGAKSRPREETSASLYSRS